MSATNIYVTGDQHFGHANIISFCQRPFTSVEEMDEALITNWNNTVKRTDKVFILGDLSFYNPDKTAAIVYRLKGYKVLILGNHDRQSAKFWLDAGMSEVSKYPIVYMQKYILSHEPLSKPYSCDRNCYLNIHAHTHNNPLFPAVTRDSICASVEHHDYKPVQLNKLIQKIEEVQIAEVNRLVVMKSVTTTNAVSM